MRKYIIRDKNDIKKTVYAKDLAHALTFVDSKVEDFEPFFFKEDETFKADADYFGERLKIENFIDKYNDYEDFIDTEFTAKVLGGFGNPRENKEMRRYFEEKWPQKAKLAHKLFDSMDSKVKDDNVVYSSSKTGIDVVYKDGWYRLKKDGKYSDWKGDKKNAIFFADKPHAIRQFNWVNDSIKDEANLPTTLQALVNDEEAAIKAYEVAIKNLEGKIDETQMQVLINIMKDERRHVENLYAILNGQVTEKNLEDSISSLYTQMYKQKQEQLKRKVFKIISSYKPEDLEKMTNKQLKEIVKEIDEEGGTMFEVDEYFRINRSKYSIDIIRRFNDIVDGILPR